LIVRAITDAIAEGLAERKAGKGAEVEEEEVVEEEDDAEVVEASSDEEVEG
jgi:hypothetical protein